MPEGPEVRLIGDTLAKTIGKTITNFQHTTDSKYKWSKGITGWDKLSQHEVEDVIIKGKLIRIDLKDNISILNTLGLEGHWALSSLSVDPKYERVWFVFGDDIKLSYCDSRNFGTIKVVDRKEAVAKMDKIGWDLLQSPMDPQEWTNLQTKLKNKVIGEALMDQKYFSGIGNIYKAEILYELKINPKQLIGQISNTTWDQVNHIAHKTLQSAYQHKGSSVKSYHGGLYQKSLKVYRKKECPVKHPISSIKQKQRTTWFCSVCQP